MKIIILGLRRSGTSIFWQAFRQDPRLLGLNEPFNPMLRNLPAELPNRSRAEFIEIFHEDPEHFWRVFAPIGRIEELQEGFSDRQREYLRFLLEQSSSLVFDATRCHFKVADLHATLPDAVLVHLVRHPAAMASSHLLPSGSGGHRTGRLVRWHGRRGFWTRRDRYNSWGIEDLVGQSPDSLFGQRCREIGLDPERVLALPAVGRLLAFWRVAFERVEADGRREFGERYLRVHFESFCRDPAATVRAVYERLGEEPPAIEYPGVHPPNPAHAAGDPRWHALFEQLGIPDGLPA